MRTTRHHDRDHGQAPATRHLGGIGRVLEGAAEIPVPPPAQGLEVADGRPHVVDGGFTVEGVPDLGDVLEVGERFHFSFSGATWEVL